MAALSLRRNGAVLRQRRLIVLLAALVRRARAELQDPMAAATHPPLGPDCSLVDRHIGGGRKPITIAPDKIKRERANLDHPLNRREVGLD